MQHPGLRIGNMISGGTGVLSFDKIKRSITKPHWIMLYIQHIYSLKLGALLLASLCLQCLAYTQSKPALVFEELNQEDGLTSLFNAHFTRDSRGFFWTSSRDGLNRFDSKNIKIYRPTFEGNSIDPNITSRVFEDEQQNLWFSSTTALHCLRAKDDTLLTFKIPGTDRSYYYAFHLNNDQYLWFVADKVVHTFDMQHLLFSEPIGDFNAYVAYAIEIEKKQVSKLVRPLIDMGTGFEVSTLKGGEIIKRDSFLIKGKGHDQSYLITNLHIESNESFWIPSSKGLVHINPNQPEEMEVYVHDTTSLILNYRTICPWKEDYYWIASLSNGLLLFDKKQKVFVQQDSIFFVNNRYVKLNTIHDIWVDSQSNLWLTNYNLGFFYANLDVCKFQQFFPLNTLAENDNTRVNTVSIDQNGNIYANVVDDGIYHFDKYGHLKRKIKYGDVLGQPSRPNTIINSLYFDNNNDLWVLSSNAVVFQALSNNKIKLQIDDLDYPLNIAQISDYEYVLMDYSKIYLLRKNTESEQEIIIEVLEENLYLPGRFFYVSEHQLLFVNQGDNNTRVYSFKEGFQELEMLTNTGSLNSVANSQQKAVIWLATSLGLFEYDINMHKAKQLKGDSDKIEKILLGVEEDKMGYLWISSYDGIFRFNIENGKVEWFTQNDGFFSKQFSVNCSLKDTGGRVYFGNNQGIVQIDPEILQYYSNVPQIHLLDINVNNTPLADVDNLLNFKKRSFEYYQNSFDFNFIAIDFSSSKNNHYKFILSGAEEDTVTNLTSGSINYQNLSPGKYQLNVLASNSDGFWTKRGEGINLIVKKPFWETWWFRLLMLILLLWIIYSYYRFRLNQIREKEMMLRKEAEFKQKEAEYKQLVAETQTAVLRLQMNPHFIFNSMNSISNYILRKDINTANDYLVRFSKLMRSILDYSEKTFISLSQEIQINEQYIDAEAMRFKHAIQYLIEVDEAIDPDEVLLPPMILQPFIENAIIHGLSKKQGKGTIRMIFKSEANNILCIIEDDGQGRVAARKARTSEHESKAIEITEKRLQLLSADQSEASLQIIDLYDTANKASGTRVLLQIPML